MDAVLEKLAPMLEKNEADIGIVAVETDEKKIWEIIEKLEPILVSHSTQCVELIDEARSIPGSEELIRYMDEFEFKQAVEALEEIKKKLGG